MSIKDINKIADSFSKAAHHYQKYATLQKIVAYDLAKKFCAIVKSNSKIVDLGCGTGFLADFILDFSSAHPNNIIRLDISPEMLKQNKTGKKLLADIANPPFKINEKFDFIVSSLAFQWLSDPIKTILQYQKFLTKKGVFICSFVGGNTFFELVDVLQECQIKLNINHFLSVNNLVQNLEKKNFFIDSKKIVLQYDGVLSLLKSIKKIGAGNSDYKNRLTKSDFQKIDDVYFKKYSIDHKIPCSWEIITISNNNEAIF